MAGTVGTKSALFFQRQAGGMFSITDEGQTQGAKWFCDSNATEGADADGHGQNPNAACLTVQYVITNFAQANDTIFVLPGHREAGDAVLFDADVVGLKIIGLGVGNQRPRFDFDNAASTIDVGANAVTLKNLMFRAGADSVLIGIDIEANVIDTVIEDCEFLEASTAGDEFVVMVSLTDGNNCTDIHRNIMRTEVAAGAATHAVNMLAACDYVRIYDNIMYGNWSTAAIGDTAAGAACYIAHNTIKVADGLPGITLQATATGHIAYNLIESTGLAPDLMIVAAACALNENYGVTIDGDNGILIGPAIDATPGVTGLGTAVVRGTGVVPQTATLPLFTVGTGDVLITAIIGEVDTNDFGAVANATHLELVPTTGQLSPLCATLDLTGTTIGTQLGISGVVSDTLQKHAMVLAAPVVAQIGTINMDCAGSEANACQVQWTIFYKPLVAGATVVVA